MHVGQRHLVKEGVEMVFACYRGHLVPRFTAFGATKHLIGEVARDAITAIHIDSLRTGYGVRVLFLSCHRGRTAQYDDE